MEMSAMEKDLGDLAPNSAHELGRPHLVAVEGGRGHYGDTS